MALGDLLGDKQTQLLPGSKNLGWWPAETQKELLSLFPELKTGSGAYGRAARMLCRVGEGRVLAAGG